MVNVCVGYENRFLHAFEIGKDFFEHVNHLVAVASVSAIDKQYLVIASYNYSITSAGRFDKRYFRVIGYFVSADARVKVFAL